MQEILDILEKNCNTKNEEIATMLNISKDEVKKNIKKLEKDNVILGYKALINWESTGKETVNAIIEVKVTPQRGQGFDSVADRIYRYPEVQACYLMSGGYDLLVVVEGKTMKEVAMFVAQKLAPQDTVLSTATHFVLKKYKDKGVVFDKKAKDDREAIVL